MGSRSQIRYSARRLVVTRRSLLALFGVLLALGACRKRPSSLLRIAVVPKGTTHEFWKTVHAGTVKAARELGVEVVWKGPLKEDDLRSQIDLVQSFVAQRVAGIVLAPLNDKALVASVRGAVEAGIPVVVFDSDLGSSDPVSFVATDNRAAGRLGGERMAKLLGGRGKLVVLRYQEGSASTHHREEGFIQALRAHSGLELVSANQYAGPTTETAFSASENLLSAQQAASGGVSGVFCPNESTTFGMLLALRKLGLAGKLKFVGFDTSDKLVEGLRRTELDALVLQHPFRMGELAVKTLVMHLRKSPVERRIDTGAMVVDHASLGKPEVRELIHPNLEPWLGPGG
jgi:ribose transport system substrate-binding protein